MIQSSFFLPKNKKKQILSSFPQFKYYLYYLERVIGSKFTIKADTRENERSYFSGIK